MKDKEKQITEMAKEKCKHFTEIVCHKIDCKTQCKYYGKANCHNCTHKSICTYFENCDCEQEVKEYGCKHYQPKLSKDSVVLSREEYDEYQSFKNGDYCATKCDIHELSFNQMNEISDLKNENEKLKKEIKNPNEVLEDRERFRARNEELKKQLKQSSQKTAEKIYKLVDNKLDLYRNGVIGGSLYDSGYQSAIYDVKRTIKELFEIEIKE